MATKFALEDLTDALRLEMRDTNIKIVLIEPGPISTKIRANSIAPFERWIEWENSVRAEKYKATLLPRIYKEGGPDPFELPPEAVIKKLIHAIEARNPRPRYFVTTPTYLMATLRLLLPTWALDWVLSRPWRKNTSLLPFWPLHQIKPQDLVERVMASGSIFFILIVAILAVILVLMFGLGGLAKGKGWAHSNSNKLMRWRIILQAVAVVLILIYAYYKHSGG